MSKYSGLDKVVLVDLVFIESYEGGKIYKSCIDGTYTATKRKFCIDEQFNNLEDARDCIDHFNED